MKITAITKYKHGELYAILTRLKWNQSELSRRCGLDPGRVGEVMNVNKRPTQKTADAIQKALGEAGEYFDPLEQWPETFAGIRPGTMLVETVDVPMECLISCREAMMLPAPDTSKADELSSAMDSAMESLTEREKAVIEARFFADNTLAEVGKKMNVSAGRARQLELRALRKLRHPSRIIHLQQFAPSLA